MLYQPDIYLCNRENSCRFALGVSGSNPLLVIGLNPSTADDRKSDQTIRKVMGFAERNEFDGFVMLNLYAQRSTLPEGMHLRAQKETVRQNNMYIQQQFSAYSKPCVLAAWGQNIQIRPYLAVCLRQIVVSTEGFNAQWLQIGASLTKAGHPRHPSRPGYSSGLHPFDIEGYLKAFN